MKTKKNLLKTSPKNRLSKYLVLITMLLSVGVWGQVSMSTTGNYTQDFNSLISTSTGTWTQNSSIANWYAQRSGTGTGIAADTGTSNGGNLYSYGSTGSSDRALGSLGSGNAAAGNFAYGVLLRNASSASITDLKVSYTLEQWRNGGVNAAQALTFYYKISSSSISDLQPNTSAGWTEVSTLNSSSPIFSTTAAALNGNLAANKITKSDISIPGLSLAAGDYILLKWDDPDHTGSDHGLSIDDVTIAWTVASSTLTPPILTAAVSATVDNPFAVTFTDNPAWRGAITGITVAGASLTGGYALNAGNITFTPSASNPATLLQTDATRTIVVKATGYSDATVSQPISAGAATKLIISTQPVGPAANGGVLATQPQLYIADQYSNPTSSSSASVTAAVGAGSWTLGGTTTVAASSSNVNYSGLTATSGAAVTGATIVFSATGLTSATSNPFNIVAAVVPVVNSSLTKSSVYGIADSYTITATGAPTSFNATGLPTGLTVDTSTGVISGVATSNVGSYNVSISATNANGTDTKILAWTITQKPLTITGLTAENKIYNGNTNATFSTAATLTGVVGTDAVSLTGTAVGTFADKNFGTGKTVTITGLSLTGAKAGNYSLPTTPNATTTADITKKALTISAPTIASRVYSSGVLTTGAITVGTLSGFVNTETVSATATGTYADADAGIGKTATVTYVLADGTNGGLTINYSLVNGTGTGDVTKATPTYTSTSISVTVGAAQTIASSISNSPGTLTFTSLNPAVATVDNTGIVRGVTVGGTSVSVTQAEDVNYFGGSTSVSVSVSVTDIAIGTYETTSAGNWPNATAAATWRRMTSMGWEDPTTRPSPSATDVLIVKHALTTNANFAASGGTTIIVENGGKFTDNHASTLSSIHVKNGGEFVVGATGVIMASTDSEKIIESGGTLTVNAALTNALNFWRGTEDFKSGSTVDFADYSGALLASPSQISNNTAGYLFGNLKFSGSTAITLIGTNTASNFNLAENDFILNGASNNILITSAASKNIVINGNTFINAGVLRGMTSLSTLTLNGNLEINGGTVNIGATSNSSVVFGMKLKGDLKVLNSSTLTTSDPDSELIFEGVGTGLTPESTQNVSIAATSTISNVRFKVNAGSYVKLDTNLTLPSPSSLTVNSGGTFDFGFDSSNNALVVSGNSFTAQSESTLKITSPYGITTAAAGALAGNVQTTVANRTFNADATYHYIGKANQLSGNGLPDASSAKKVIVELDQDTYTFQPNGLKLINTSGYLEIKKGIVLDNATGSFGDSDTDTTTRGELRMSGGRYRLFKTGTNPGLSGIYTLTGGVVEFANANASDQTIRNKSYYNIEVTGKPVGNSNGNITILGNGKFTVKNGGEFTINANAIVGPDGTQTLTVENGGLFKTGDVDGFSGSTNTSVRSDIESIVLEAGSTVEYSRNGIQTITVGAVTTPATGNYQNLTISGSGEKYPIADLTVNDVTTVSAGTLKILATQDTEQPHVFTAKKGIKNTGGTVILENNANLLQDQGVSVSNSGNIIAQRSAKLKFESVSKADYNYWSSPVIDQKLLYNTMTPLASFSPGTPNNRIFEYKESNDTFVATSNPNFVAGKGYAIRAENGQNGSSYTADGIAKTFEFIGEPNNGDVSTPSLAYSNATHGYNLVGNPYPSIIDFNLLHSANSDLIGSTAYFWTNVIYTPSQQGSSSAGYTGSNYATFNGVGGVAAGGSSLEPTKYIKTGQGFIVQAKKAGQLNFTNAMRQTGISPFFNNKVDDEKNRFWVTLITPSDMTNTILIGYVEGATNGFEKDYDAPILVNGSDSFYSVLGNEKLVIQGKSSSFSSDDIISVGAKYYETGIHKIQLKKKEGIFNGSQNVYLKDKLLNKVVNLSNGDYTFQTTKGTTDTRFEIVYKDNAVLGTGNESKSDFLVYRDGNDVVIKSSKNLGKVEVYDAAGRMVVAQKATDKILRLNVSTLAEGMFIIKAENSGDTKTKKILK